MEHLLQFSEFMRPHWNTAALVLTWLGIGFVWMRRRQQWRRKQFLAQVNFSLNYVAEGGLAMRTLLETKASDVWLNEYGVRHVYAAAKRATVDQPYLVLANAQDRDFANRAVLNVLSERFAETYLAASLGLPTRTAPYVFGITFEKYGEIRTLKLRVLVVAEATLVDLFGPQNAATKLRIPNAILQARLTTLRIMYDLYVKDRGAERPTLGHMELGVRA